MAGRAVRGVERLVAPRHELEEPRHLVRIHVEQPACWIERRASPFAAAIHPREDDRAFVVRRIEGVVPAVLLELPECGGVGLGRSRCEIVPRYALSREWRWHGGEVLTWRRTVAGQRRRGHVALFHGEERLSGGPVENVHVTRLGDLRYRFHRLTVAPNGDEDGCRGEI